MLRYSSRISCFEYELSIRLRENQLLNFSAKRLVGREEAESRQLLSDRAAALRRAAQTHVRERRQTDPEHVEPGVVVEPLILNRNHRLHQVRRYLIEWNLDSLFLENRERELIAAVVDGRCLVHLSDVPQRFGSGQAASQAGNEPDERDKRRRGGEGGSEQDPFDQLRAFGP